MGRTSFPFSPNSVFRFLYIDSARARSNGTLSENNVPLPCRVGIHVPPTSSFSHLLALSLHTHALSLSLFHTHTHTHTFLSAINEYLGKTRFTNDRYMVRMKFCILHHIFDLLLYPISD